MCKGIPHARCKVPPPAGIGHLNLSRLHSVRIRRVVEVVVAEGQGRVEDPDVPVREVTYYYDLEGKYLAHHDRYNKVKPWLDVGETSGGPGG